MVVVSGATYRVHTIHNSTREGVYLEVEGYSVYSTGVWEWEWMVSVYDPNNELLGFLSDVGDLVTTAGGLDGIKHLGTGVPFMPTPRWYGRWRAPQIIKREAHKRYNSYLRGGATPTAVVSTSEPRR